MNGFAPLAAGLENWIFPIVVLVFIIMGLIRQMMAQVGEAKQGPAPRPEDGVPPEPDPVQDEIREFVRNRAERGGAGRPQAAGARGFPAERPAEVELVEPPPRDDGGVAEHVRERLRTAKFDHPAPEVVGDVSHADGKVQTHIHTVFDHKVGRLVGRPGESAEPAGVSEPESPADRIGSMPSTAAAGLAAMLANPGSLRQAILLSEIINRPEHRWK